MANTTVIIIFGPVFVPCVGLVIYMVFGTSAIDAVGTNLFIVNVKNSYFCTVNI